MDKVDSSTLPIGSASNRPLLQFSFLKPGARFAGRYEIVRSLGAGGTGEVFEAQDCMAQTQVAVKVLFPRSGSETMSIDRLRREINIVRGLSDTGIVRVFDIGESDGLLYMVMQHLQGESLKERIARGPLSTTEATTILEELLQVLIVTHARFVVHRDIKPGNIFLVDEPDGAKRVVLLDFGLARQASDRTLTSTGGLLGTPEYMSPEQINGDEATLQVDLYSLGIVLWEMLSGAPPFTGDSSLRIADAHLRQPIPNPRQALPPQPRWLTDLVVGLLQKKPGDRISDATAALAHLRARRRLPLLRRWTQALRVQGSSRNRAAAVAIIVMILAGVGWWLWHLPAAVKAEGSSLSKVNYVGAELSRSEAPFRIAGVVPIEPDPTLRGDHLVGIEQPIRLGPASGISYFDSMTGAWSPLNFVEVAPRPYPFFGERYWVQGIVDIGVHPGSPERRYMVTYISGPHYPTTAMIIDRFGGVFGLLNHAGRLGRVSTLPAQERGGQDLFVITGVNNVLSQRSVVIGFFLVAPGESTANISTPPYEINRGSRSRPHFYTFLPDYSTSEGTLSGETLTLWLSNGENFLLDARTGCPIAPRDRNGINCDTWIRNQADLLNALEQSTEALQAQRPLEAARTLTDFIARRELDKTQQGVLRERAALLLQIAGELDESRALVELTLTAEPEVPGHYRRLIEVTARSGDVGPAAARLSIAPTGPRTTREVIRDLFLAYLVTGEPDRATETLPRYESPTGDTTYYRCFTSALTALHRNDPRAALAANGPDLQEGDSHLPFLRALSLVLLDPADPEATRMLQIAEESGGSGNDVPFEALRAYIDGSGESALTDEALLAALSRHAQSAKRDIVSLYYAGWARALALEARPHLAGRIADVLEPAVWERRWRQLREAGETEPPWASLDRTPVTARRAAE